MTAAIDVRYLYVVLFFLLGALLGGVYTVLIHRVPNQIAIKKMAVFCPNCNGKLKFVDIIPIFSYLKLRGKCRNCDIKISRQYLLIEVLTALTFAGLYLHYGISFALLLNLAFYSMLIVTFVIDLKHMVVSDAVLFMFSPVVLIYLIATDASWIDHLLGLAAGFVLFLLIYLLTKWIYKREAFGFGDVMLSGAVGWFLGLQYSILTSILTFLVAFVIIIFLRVIGKSIKKEMEIPFAPFICTAALISSLFGRIIIDFYWGI